MINVILSGGSGTRLWPVSRSLFPKQYIKFFNNKSLFQLTVERNLKFCHECLIVSNTEQFFVSLEQLDEINVKSYKYILEPIGRNTAPAIAMACFMLDKDEVVLVAPSDHLIKNEKEYLKAIKEAEELANQNFLVTFGIRPTFPNTGFGYIKSDGVNVSNFYEKPSYDLAKKFFNDKNYYWNSGIFMFKAGVFLEELKIYAEDIYESCKRALENTKKDNIVKMSNEDMLCIPENSIDYAVMEKSKNVKMISADIGWSDVGSFDALYDDFEKDENLNNVNFNHISIESKNSLIYGSYRKIATIDINDLIIIDTPDALLVSKRGSSQKVRDVVKKIKATNSDLVSVNTTMYRPWGSYTVLEKNDGFKIKKITVKPGKRLSLQKHFHRSEHWIIVSGTATVTINDEIKLIRPNESTYIKMGEVHRLSNDGKIPVVLVEVQVGEYTGEDDIVRIEDDFNRVDVETKKESN